MMGVSFVDVDVVLWLQWVEELSVFIMAADVQADGDCSLPIMAVLYTH